MKRLMDLIARHFTPPPVVISRSVTSPHASDGTFLIRIQNNDNRSRQAIYSEIWPWWVKGWMSEISMSVGALNATRRASPLLPSWAS